MRWRNDTALDVIVHLDPPVTVPPGEEIESDEHIAGPLTPVEEPPAEPEPAPVVPAPAASSKPSKATKDGAQ